MITPWSSAPTCTAPVTCAHLSVLGSRHKRHMQQRAAHPQGIHTSSTPLLYSSRDVAGRCGRLRRLPSRLRTPVPRPLPLRSQLRIPAALALKSGGLCRRFCRASASGGGLRFRSGAGGALLARDAVGGLLAVLTSDAGVLDVLLPSIAVSAVAALWVLCSPLAQAQEAAQSGANSWVAQGTLLCVQPNTERDAATALSATAGVDRAAEVRFSESEGL